MKIKSFLSLASLCGVFAATALAQNSVPFVKDEVLVKFKTETTSAARAEAVDSANIVERLAETGWVRVKLGAGEDVNSAIGRFKGRREIEAVQPNYYYHLLLTPNDPLFTSP